ncbi:MAG: tetratricopeptide repeat protein [Bacteroidales bacterium]|nr:tetratricopeptide repeat protein [Bacteroidales bacterium]
MKTKLLTFLLILACAACSHFTGDRGYTQASGIIAADSLWTPTGNAQLDSLLQLAAIAPQDTILAQIYFDIGEIYENTDFEKAKEYYLKTGALSEQLHWNKGRYLYASGFALILTREMLTDSAVVILKKAMEFAKYEKNESWSAYLLHNIGNAYRMTGWNETALNYYLQALPIFEKENNSQRLQALYSNLSRLYCSFNLIEKAIEYGEKAVSIDREDVFALSALGKAYSSARQFEKSKIYLEEALRICELQNNLYLIEHIYFLFADDALTVFDLERAEKYAHKSMEINEQFGREACCPNFVLLSKIEMLKGNYAQSEKYVKEALEIAIELDVLEIKRICLIMLSELTMAQGKYRENAHYCDELDLVEKEMAKETALRASEEMSAKYETAKKEHEIERQQLVIGKQNTQRIMLAAGIGLCIVFLVLLLYILQLRNRRNAVLAQMNATKDKFFSIISHDLKNPAIAQREAIQLLMKNGSSWDVDTLSEYYAELMKSADGQVELLFNLLNWAKVQTGRMVFKPAPFSPATHLRPDLLLIRSMAEKKGVELKVAIPDDALVTGDSDMLVTVVRNLLTNAVKFTPAGGLVSFSVEPFDKDKYTICVSDTGMGMSKEQVGRLFCMEHGSGLGLIVCRELLEKHNSILHVESQEGVGSRFWFECGNSHK